ncbi:MAG TPA: hypothetical protein VK666_18025, partial [Chryseolinea sp.]|nr:hypothetical protein [Chryseolinea sp.]
HGNISWRKTFGGNEVDAFQDIEEAINGDVYVLGTTSSSIPGQHGESDIWIVKLNAMGGQIWQKAFGGSSSELARDLFPTIDGGFLIAGTTSSNNGNVSGNHGGTDGWIFKIDRRGEMKWQKTYGGTNTDILNAITAKPDGSFAAGGWSYSTDGGFGNKGKADLWVISDRK